MGNINFSSVLIGLVLGLVFGVLLHLFLNAAGISKAKLNAKSIVEEANNQAKNTVKQAVLDGKTQVYDLKLQAEKELKERN